MPTAPEDFPSNDRFEQKSEPLPGGMGVVWKALDRRLERIVALKRIRVSRDDSDNRRLFHREIRNQAAIHHPCVNPLFESYEDADGPYFVMPWIDGQSLRQWIHKASQPHDIHEVLHILKKVSEGLDWLHKIQLVHSDLKPANIMLTATGQPVILDFGMSFWTTRPGESPLGGTWKYMSPELKSGQHAVTWKSDLFSFGLIASEMLEATQLPFSTDPETVQVLEKSLHTDPECRWTSAGLFVRCLEFSITRLLNSRLTPERVLRLPFSEYEARSVQAERASLCQLPSPFPSIGGIEFVLIPAGQLIPGTGIAGERHARLCRTPTLLLSRDIVSQSAFSSLGSGSELGQASTSTQPARVSSHQASEFCAALSKRYPQNSGSTFRIPLDHEWEFACRGGTLSDFWWSGTSDPNQIPHPFGLRGMAISGPEWCREGSPRDPNHAEFVRCGGSPTSTMRHQCRSAWNSGPTGNMTDRCGFRVALTLR